AGFESAGMPLHREAARARLGALEDGAAGEALVAESRQQLTALGVARPEALTAAFAPGFPASGATAERRRSAS
ncbi:MAG: hypothetical protein ACR2P8_14225, partial [Myxococcota bacterium]